MIKKVIHQQPKSSQTLKKDQTLTLQKKKSQIIEKIALFLKNKFSKLFQEKNYSSKQLHHDLNNLITEDDLKNKFEYNITILKIEKTILEILSKMESTQPSKGIFDMNKINSLITTNQKNKNNLNKNLEPLSNREKNPEVNKNILNSINQKQLNTNKSSDDINILNLNKKDKLLTLKEKSKDEWALIARHNYQKFLESEKDKKIQEENNKKIQREILELQMKEKEILKKKEKEEFKNFYQDQIKNLKKVDQQEKQKEIQVKEKILKEKESQDKVIDMTKKIKQEVKGKEKLQDQKILERIKNEIESQEEKINNKKIQQREVYKKLIMENEEKAKMKKIEKLNEKIENQKVMEEYSKLIEKQDEERKMNFINRLGKIKGQSQSYDVNVRKKDDIVKAYEQNKLIREQEDRELRKKIEEEKSKEKRQQLTDEMKRVLKTQLEEKKMKQNLIKDYDKKYVSQINSNVDNYKKEIKMNEKNKVEKILSYKQELDRQRQNKENLGKKGAMDDIEKGMNRDLIDEINYENFSK